MKRKNKKALLKFLDTLNARTLASRLQGEQHDAILKDLMERIAVLEAAYATSRKKDMN